MVAWLFGAVLIVSLCLLGFHYVGYPLSLFALLSLSSTERAEPEGELTERPDVSLIVAAHNEVDVIERKLANVSQTEYGGNFECIVVSDSTDETDALVKRHAGPKTRLLALDERRGKSFALNRAVSEATGDILVFSDANTTFDPNTISRLVEPFADPSVGCTTGRLNLLDAEGKTTESLYWTYELWIRALEAQLGTTVGVNGGVLAVRANAYSPIPNDALVDDLFVALQQIETGRRVVYVPDAQAREYTTGSLWDEYTRRVRIGTGNYQALVRFANLLNPTRGMVAFEFFSHKVLRWFAPGLLVVALASNLALVATTQTRLGTGFLVLQATCYAFAAIGLSSARAREFAPFSIPAYYLGMNVALFVGLWNFVNGGNYTVWKSTPRNE